MGLVDIFTPSLTSKNKLSFSGALKLGKLFKTHGVFFFAARGKHINSMGRPSEGVGASGVIVGAEP